MTPARCALRHAWATVIVVMACVTSAGTLDAQAVPSTSSQLPTPPGTIRVSVLTLGQGNEVFERFGHNALRVVDPVAGTDVAYNWGMFSFDQPGFIRRFLNYQR